MRDEDSEEFDRQDGGDEAAETPYNPRSVPNFLVKTYEIVDVSDMINCEPK